MQKSFVYCFVILHYNVVKETTECIESIKKRIHGAKYHIVVVDNASPNKSGKELEQAYAQDELVTILLNEKNLGFARGNNVGIYYARDVLKADFVVVMNNDTYLIQDDFVQVIEDEWDKSGFAVLGPYVESPDMVNQNPVPVSITTKKQLSKLRYDFRTDFLRTYLGVDDIWKSLKAFVKKILKVQKPIKVSKIDVRQENIKLHGCCWVFSPAYFKEFKGLDDRTFMYLEEDILFNHVINKKLLTVYNPLLKIYHSEDASTNSVVKTRRAKRLFVQRQHLKSIKVLEKVIKERTMLNISNKTTIYVLCPSYNKTGGTELAHQLVYAINQNHIDAKIAYYENYANGGGGLNPMKINDAFLGYVDSFVTLDKIVDSPDNILIAPEVCTEYLKSYKAIQKCIWWMSVDNYLKWHNVKVTYQYNGLWTVIKGIIKRKVRFGLPSFDPNITHFYQSEYAKKFLEKCGAAKSYRLSDYLNKEYLDVNPGLERKDVVLYNPRKGYAFTKKLIDSAPEIMWRPLQNMTTEQVKDTLLCSKVYIDFGNHPGKDRFPREAAMCGCCVITGKRGSAKFFEDVPIADEFKFEENNESLERIIGKIKNCLADYSNQSKKFDGYREFIKGEYDIFQEDVKKIFVGNK